MKYETHHLKYNSNWIIIKICRQRICNCMNYNVIQITTYNFKTDLLQNHSSNSFHVHNTSHLNLMNKLPGLINFLYFFFFLPELPNGS